MAVICPTVTAFDLHEYRSQLEVASSLAERVHIDLMDGDMAPTKSPDLSRIWLPYVETDIHLMYLRPMNEIEKLIQLKPNMVIIQAEAEVHHMLFAGELHKNNIKAGLCLLHNTSVEKVEKIIHSFDHVLIFSGKLGYHGGKADFSLAKKIKQIRQMHDEVEIGWDGGINEKNIKKIAEMDVDILNVGGYIQKSKDSKKAYKILQDTLV